MDKFILDKINTFTQSPLTEDDVFIFNVILCDNDIDRDLECFSKDALESLKDLFVGKTGISDHNMSSALQHARIFDTELITDSSRKTSDGRDYIYLKASVYMVRTDSNKDLISEITGGIKKEVSISCSASKKTCSICNCDRNVAVCSHSKGTRYNSKMCHHVLSEISDAYEWSFVAVPAQVNAGVTKHFSTDSLKNTPAFSTELVEKVENSLREDIIKLAFIKGGEECVKAINLSFAHMDTSQLLELKKSLDIAYSDKVTSQLFNSSSTSFGEFSLK